IPARSEVAVTGELTLRGNILPVAGVKDKVLAAHRVGIRAIVLPARNERELEDIPAEIKQELSFHLVQRIDEVLPLVLTRPLPSTRDAGRSSPATGEARA